MLTRHVRALALGVLIAAPVLVLRAQVPAASDPPKYVLPPPNIVAVFDAELLPQTVVSPNRQVVAMTINQLAEPEQKARPG